LRSRVSTRATVSLPIAARSLTLIADALSHAPVVEVIDALLDDDPRGRDLS